MSLGVEHLLCAVEGTWRKRVPTKPVPLGSLVPMAPMKRGSSSSAPPAPKRERTCPDVAARKQASKNLENFVVRKKLDGFCKLEACDLLWSSCILDVNHAVMEVSLPAEFYAFRQLAANTSGAEISARFYQTCLSLVTSQDRRRSTSDVDKYAVLRATAKDVLDGVFTETFESIPVRMADPIVMELRERTPRTSSDKICWSPHDPMPVYYEFLQHVEAGNEKNANDPTHKPKRTLSVLPTKQGFKASSCKVASTGLRSLLHRECGVVTEFGNQQEVRVCRDGVVRKFPVHKVLLCMKKHGGCGKTENRDVNAAHNMLEILQRQLAGVSERPPGLQRRPRS